MLAAWLRRWATWAPPMDQSVSANRVAGSPSAAYRPICFERLITARYASRCDRRL